MRTLLASILLTAVLPLLSAWASEYAPLNCSRAKTPADRTICRNYALGQREARMATLFAVTTSLIAMGQRGDIQDAQRAWLGRREACGDRVACLIKAYDARIDELNTVLKAIAARGPF
jgi:uncharacterized protein